MKTQMFLMILACLCSMAIGSTKSTPSNLDTGGIIDPAQSQVEKIVAQDDNMIKFGDFEDEKVDLRQKPLGNWESQFYVHGKEHKALEPKLQALTTRAISNDNPASGNRCASLITPLDVNQDRDSKGLPMISNRIIQNVVLPETTGQSKYQLSFKLRGKLEDVPGLNSFRGFVLFYDKPNQAKAKQVGEMLEVPFILHNDWRDNSLEFIAPAGALSLHLALALYGCGEAYIDDVKLQKIEL